jgi:hypothetical protein
MEFIVHRINTAEELSKIPQQSGIEIDLRDRYKHIIIQHDPFVDGEDFENYLKCYKHGTLILNIKSDRIELRILELLKKYQIKNYFLLDCSFPMIYELSLLGEKKIALRFSEFEGLENIMAMKGKAEWVWVDCFTKLPLDHQIFSELKKAGFKLCLASPELQGRPEDIEPYKAYLEQEKIVFDAICTKKYNLDKWK